MPIEFAPPPPATQGYQITPVQYSDPLQTLAQMGQLRTQGLQQQGAQQELELNRAKLDSQKGMLKAMVDSGGDPKKFQTLIAQPGYNILPGDALAYQEHQTKLQQDIATRDETVNKNRATNIDLLRGLYNGVTDEPGLAAAHARADQLGIPANIPRYTGQFDRDHLQAFSAGLAGESQLLKEGTEKATAEKEKAGATLSGVQTTEAQQKVDVAERAAAIAEAQAAEVDPKTGTPTPAATAAIQARHPKVQMPPPGNKQAFDAWVRSGVPVEKQPEYDINKIKADLGLLGNSEFDQYQLRYAQSINKKPNQLTFPEMQTVLQQYAKDKQTPELLEAILSLKASQGTVAKAQVASILTPEQIQSNARDLLNGDLAPDQIKELRPGGRVNQGAQIIEAARAIAKAEGKDFSLFDLQQQATEREKTLQEFTNTTAGHAGGQKLALNTLIHHADLYLDAAKALKNGSFRPGNEIYNKVATAFGSAPPTNAALLAQFFASETGKVATGGVPAEGEVKSILDKMSTSGSPEAMEGAGKTLLGIAAGRMIPLKELRDKANLQNHVDILGPDAREILSRRGFDPETMKPMAAGAKPSAKTYKYNFQKDGHKIGSDDGKTWYDRQTGQKLQ